MTQTDSNSLSRDPVAGVVVIGRNEGERLRQCLTAIQGCGLPAVYVDSGSVDGSVATARTLGFDVVELDDSEPFTAARGRNAGLAYLTGCYTSVEFVQFVDGDCLLSDGWLDRAVGFLESNPKVAVVCGRVREQCRDASVYNRLCDLEWDQPAGEAQHCGGIAMMRVGALKQVGGFDPAVIGGEDTELCVRLRMADWKIWRQEDEMTLHDAAMTRVGQWWQRALRAGCGFAQGASLHRRSRIQLFARESRSPWFWAGVLPLTAGGAFWFTHGVSLLILLAYPLQVLRVYRGMRRRGVTHDDALAYAVHCVAAKFPQLLGVLRFHWLRRRGRRQTIIEHKKPTPPASSTADGLQVASVK